MAELLNKIPTNLTEYPNSFKRQDAFPLEAYSVFYDLNAAKTYATSNPIAYVGQTLAVVTAKADDANSVDKVTFYIIADEKGTLQEVGKTTTTVVVDVADDSALSVTESYDDKTDIKTYLLDVDIPEAPQVPVYSVTADTATEGKTTYQLTKDGEAVGETIEIIDYSELPGKVQAVEAAIDVQEGRIDDIEAQFDTFWSGIDNKNEIIDTLYEIQTHITTDEAAASQMLQAIGNNTAAIGTLNGGVTEAGSVAKTVADAIAAQATLDASKYATAQALDLVKATAEAAAVKTDVEAALNNKVNTSDLTANYYTKDQVYTQEQINERFDNIYENNSQSAAAVADSLLKHEAANATAFANIETAQTTQNNAIKANTDAIAVLNGTVDETGSVRHTINAIVPGAITDAIGAIPAATASKLGLVKASNEITVSEDGTLGLGYVSTDKLMQGTDTLVLVGGTSSN